MAKKTIKKQLDDVIIELKNKYKHLKTAVESYTNALSVRASSVNTAYHYKTKNEKGITVVQVAELYAHVLTASKLGYDVYLKAADDKLEVIFIKKLPSVPVAFHFYGEE